MFSVTIERNGTITADHEFDNFLSAESFYHSVAENKSTRVCLFDEDGKVLQANYDIPATTWLPIGTNGRLTIR